MFFTDNFLFPSLVKVKESAPSEGNLQASRKKRLPPIPLNLRPPVDTAVVGPPLRLDSLVPNEQLLGKPEPVKNLSSSHPRTNGTMAVKAGRYTE